MSLLAAFVLCTSPVAIDGDTFRCKNTGSQVYRIGGMDAPDKSCIGRRAGNCYLQGPRGDWIASRDALRRLFRRGRVRLKIYSGMTYGRKIVAVCARDGNLSAYMIRNGYAIYKPTWNGAATRVRCP